MAFWSALLGRGIGEQYRAWSSGYFRAREEHARALLSAKPEFTVHGLPVLERHAGGMGEVLVAKHPTVGLVALKRALLRQRSSAAHERFADEAARLVGLTRTYHLVPEDVISNYLEGSCTHRPAVLCGR